MSQRSIFALELCLQLEPTLHYELSQLITQSSERMSFGDKWQRYQRACQALIRSEALWHRGCWDYWDDHTRALNDFQMWVNGMLTREGARPHPSGAPDPYRGEPRYLAFTMAVLMRQGSASELAIARECKIPESQLWQRGSFRRVLQALRWLSFAEVEKDTMYLIPRERDWGLTLEDLTHEKFQYLRPIM